MIVNLECSGGFCGLNKAATINTDNCDIKMKNRLENIIEKLKLDSNKPVPTMGNYDQYKYKLSVNNESLLLCDDSSIPEYAKKLISYLKKRAIYESVIVCAI